MDAYVREMGRRGSPAAPSPASTAMVPVRGLQGLAHVPQPPSSRTSRDVTLARRNEEEEKQPRAGGWGEQKSREEAVGEAVFPYMG